VFFHGSAYDVSHSFAAAVGGLVQSSPVARFYLSQQQIRRFRLPSKSSMIFKPRLHHPFQRLATKSGNFLVSPLSAELILALSQSGARNDTAEEIQDSLSLPRESEQIEDAVQAVLSALGPEQDYVLRIINKIYVKEDYPIREEFSAIAQDVYDAQVENIDFCNKSEAARTMNQWVEEETEDKIQDLVDPDILGNETRAVLINALRFRANWTTPFQFFATFRQDFYPADGDSVEVETMHIQDEYLEYYENPKLNASFVVLPIQGYNISMTVALPDARTGLALLEEHISQVMEIPEETSIEMLNVALPKFKIQSKIDFKEILQSVSCNCSVWTRLDGIVAVGCEESFRGWRR
jgi:serpin B